MSMFKTKRFITRKFAIIIAGAPVAPPLFSDNFSRADSSPMSTTSSSGGTWVQDFEAGGSPMQIISNVAAGTNGSSDSMEIVLSPLFNNNQSASCTVYALDAFSFYGPVVQVQTASGSVNGNFYFLRTVGAIGNSLVIYKYTTGVAATLSTITGVSFGPGDVITLQSTGTTAVTLTALINGSIVGSITDSSSPWNNGQPGMRSFHDNPVISYFSASNI